MDLAQFGVPGITYYFNGKVRYLKKDSGERFTLKREPWDLSSKDMKAMADFCNKTMDDLMEPLITMGDTMQSLPLAKRMGTPNHVDVTWEDVIDYNAKGNAVDLKYSVLGKLMVDEFVRVDDVLMRVSHNIAKPVSKDALTTYTLNKLNEVDAANLWSTRSYSLLRDHIMANCEEKTLGGQVGLLPVRNGVIDIKTMALTQTDDIYTSCANVEYNPEAKCPNIEKLLDNAFNPDQKELVLSILGAAFSGRRAPFILCLSGRGRNGKSILREMVTCLASDMITTEKLEKLHDRFSNQVFLGKRVVWETEVSSKRKFTDKIKDVTGGTSLVVEYKNQNGHIQSELQSVVILDTNSPPHLEDSQAINDRLRFIDMPRVFVYELSGAPNEILIDANLAEAWRDEMPGFLNLILPYAQHFLLTGHLKQDLKVGMDKYNEKSEVLSLFIDNWCDVGEDCSISFKTFYKYYKMFVVKQNISAAPEGQIRHALKYEYNFMLRNQVFHGLRPRQQQILESFGATTDSGDV
jgi:P4 family phage/plasmid primase-like protien